MKLLARNILILNLFINIFIQEFNMQEFVLLVPLKLVFTFSINICLSEVTSPSGPQLPFQTRI